MLINELIFWVYVYTLRSILYHSLSINVTRACQRAVWRKLFIRRFKNILPSTAPSNTLVLISHQTSSNWSLMPKNVANNRSCYNYLRSRYINLPRDKRTCLTVTLFIFHSLLFPPPPPLLEGRRWERSLLPLNDQLTHESHTSQSQETGNHCSTLCCSL